MSKRYEYNGKIYCDDDLSDEIKNYAGDLFDLLWELKGAGLVETRTQYLPVPCESSRQVYDDYEEFIEHEFSHLEVDE